MNDFPSPHISCDRISFAFGYVVVLGTRAYLSR
jgi:hypothetical protein